MVRWLALSPSLVSARTLLCAPGRSISRAVALSRAGFARLPTATHVPILQRARVAHSDVLGRYTLLAQRMARAPLAASGRCQSPCGPAPRRHVCARCVFSGFLLRVCAYPRTSAGPLLASSKGGVAVPLISVLQNRVLVCDSLADTSAVRYYVALPSHILRVRRHCARE